MRMRLSGCVLVLLMGDVIYVTESCHANLQVAVGMRLGVCLS